MKEVEVWLGYELRIDSDSGSRNVLGGVFLQNIYGDAGKVRYANTTLGVVMNFTYDEDKEMEIYYQLRENRVLQDTPAVEMLIRELNAVPVSNAEDIVNVVNEHWTEVEDNFLEKLGKFYARELESPGLTVYLVRFSKFPYSFDDGWFCAPLYGSPAERNRVIMHELCHYFQPLGLPRSVKEAIPVILNDHDGFKMYSYDRGHKDEDEQRWRKKVWELYESGGNFNDLIMMLKKGSE